jgi:DmsE family decaheme c-type cytochrome
MSPRSLHFVLVLSLCCLPGLSPRAVGQTSKTYSSDSRWKPNSFSKYLEISGAERLGSEQCRACHEAASKSVHNAIHGFEKLECEDCHGNGSLHIASPDNKQIINFREKTAEQANGVCLSCHTGNDELLRWQLGAHRRNNVKCIDCHQVHATQTKPASFQEQNAKCANCHRTQAAQANLPYHHPIREGKMACADCHNPHGSAAGKNLRADNVNQLCLQCHTEYEGPFTYQHAPVVENCAKCHTPHGSVNRSLLAVSQPMLCLQCHAAHHNGGGIPLLNQCTSCHSAIHGSDVPSATGGSVFIDKP